MLTLAKLSMEPARSSGSGITLASGTEASFLGQFLCPILLNRVLASHGMESVFYAADGVTVVAIFKNASANKARQP